MTRGRGRVVVADGVVAGGVAAVVSGLPSTLHALLVTGKPLEATLAAGSLLTPRETRRSRLVAAAVPVHLGVSLGWGVVLARFLPRRGTVAAGAAAGLAIAALDLGGIGRRYRRVRALPLLPQLADHLLYGATVGAVVAVRRSRRSGSESAPAGIPRSMSEHERPESEEQEGQDPVAAEQQGKGYGEDEGERDEALDEQNFERL